MRHLIRGELKQAVSIVLAGCAASSPEVPKPGPAKATRESLFGKGHRFYVEGQADSAAIYLKESLRLDSTYLPPLEDLTMIHYNHAMANAIPDAQRRDDFQSALHYAIRMEEHGKTDAATYELITELSNTLGQDDTFLLYARKYMERHPGDRQAYTFGLASARAGDHPAVIRSQKEAIEQWPYSAYIGGFYRLLGESYFAIDRQQTAERTFAEGVKVVDRRILDGRNNDPEFEATMLGRLNESRTAMLSGLRKIYRLHGEDKKLQEVEVLLKDSGR
jgi:tetratricopeptide (TPR) repeat protein